MNESGIRGSLQLVDTGRGVVGVVGFAKGFEPRQVYVTLFYDNTTASGPNACVPIVPNPNMLIGLWQIDDAGVGTLVATFPGSFDEIATMSVRLAPPANVPGNLQACGRLIERELSRNAR